MEHRPYQVYQYTLDLIDALTVQGDVPTVAPWEYDPTGELGDASREEALVALTDHPDLRIQDLVVLEFRIDESMLDRAVATPASLGGGVDHTYESDVTVYLTLRSFPHGDLLASVSVNFQDTAFADGATPANPRPLLRGAIEEAAITLTGLMELRWEPGVTGAPPGVNTAYNPRDMFTYQGGQGEPLEGDFAEMDDLDRRANRMVYYQYFDPDITAHTMDFFEAAPVGLLVHSVSDGEGDLLAGDYITQIEGIPVAGPQTLYRHFLLGSPGSDVELAVLRGDELVRAEVTIPTRAE